MMEARGLRRSRVCRRIAVRSSWEVDSVNRRALLRNLVLMLLVEAGLLSMVYAALRVGHHV